MDHEPLPVLHLYQDVEGGQGTPLQNGLLGATAARLLVRERDGLDAADEVGQGGIQKQVVQCIAVRRRNELDTTLGNRARRGGLQLTPDLVDDDDLGVMVFHGLDHHLVLEAGQCDLHPTCPPDGPGAECRRRPQSRSRCRR